MTTSQESPIEFTPEEIEKHLENLRVRYEVCENPNEENINEYKRSILNRYIITYHKDKAEIENNLLVEKYDTIINLECPPRKTRSAEISFRKSDTQFSRNSLLRQPIKSRETSSLTPTTLRKPKNEEMEESKDSEVTFIYDTMVRIPDFKKEDPNTTLFMITSLKILNKWSDRLTQIQFINSLINCREAQNFMTKLLKEKLNWPWEEIKTRFEEKFGKSTDHYRNMFLDRIKKKDETYENFAKSILDLANEMDPKPSLREIQERIITAFLDKSVTDRVIILNTKDTKEIIECMKNYDTVTIFQSQADYDKLKKKLKKRLEEANNTIEKFKNEKSDVFALNRMMAKFNKNKKGTQPNNPSTNNEETEKKKRCASDHCRKGGHTVDNCWFKDKNDDCGEAKNAYTT